MGIKPVTIKKYRKFLEQIGLEKIRTKGTHEIWNNKAQPLLRPVTVDSKYADVPILHIHTSLKSMGISKEDFNRIIETLG